MSSLLLTTLDTGNTAWMIMATILVLLMSIPGIALFYGGLVRQKNILSILMQTVFIVAVVSLIWVYPYQTDYCHDEYRLHQDAEDILLAHQTAVKKCNTWD